MSEWHANVLVGLAFASAYALWGIHKHVENASERARQILILLARERGHDV